MAGQVDSRLAKLGIVLPEPQKAWANYASYVVSGNLIVISGQLSQLGNERYVGGGDLDRVTRCIELGGFVNSTPDFYDHPKVLNGASDLLAEVLGDAGRHTRFAVGAAALPFNFAVEVKAIFEISR